MALPEASLEITAQAMTSSDAEDKKLFVQFMMHPKFSVTKTAEQGRPIFEDTEYVMIMVPGDSTSIVHRPVWERDRERFPLQYAAFKNKQNQVDASGTPLSAVTFLTAAQVRELEYFNCRTVEHLANMADSNATKFPGIQSLKRQAQDFLAAAAGQAPLTAMRSELEKRDEQIAALMQRLSDLESAKPEKKAKPEEK